MKSRIYIGLVIVAGFVAGLIWYIQDGESTPSVAISGNSGSSNTASDETDKATSALGGTSSSQAISNKTPPTEETKTATSNDVSVVSSSLNARGDVAPTDAPNSHNAAQVKGLNFPPVATVATEFATSRIPAISQLTHVPVENIKLEEKR